MNQRERDDELAREVQAHLEMEADEQRERGLSREAARLAARKAFGSQALAMERTREVWGWNWAEALVRNLRFALRRARRSPAPASAAPRTARA